ncbi:uncharacterized protein [Diabrotica undecimpunctata]|uniref:uncharacterized protein n=1 Tax=Diabrotica undecimpunctata TaxID=50387 RepID=UPI003B64147D
MSEMEKRHSTVSIDTEESFRCSLRLELKNSLSTVEQVQTVTEKMSELFDFIDNDTDPSKRMTKSGKDGLKTRIMASAMDQANLIGQIQVLKEENGRQRAENELLRNKLSQKQQTERVSYARITAKTESEIKIEMQKQSNTLFITSDNAQTEKKAQEQFTQVLDPRQSKIRINRMRTTGKAFIIETTSKEDLEKICNVKKVKEQFKSEFLRKRKSMVIIYDIPSNEKEEDIVDKIHMQIFEGMSKKEFAEGFRIRFKTGPRGKLTVHYVAEVFPDLRKRLISNRIFIGFFSVNAKDYIVVPKCVKCQDLDHVIKHCTKETACSHCGEGHAKKDCSKTGQPRVCIPCKIRVKICNKDTKDCPTYKMLLDRFIQKADYGKLGSEDCKIQSTYVVGQSKTPSKRLRNILRMLSFRRKKKEKKTCDLLKKDSEGVLALDEDMKLNMRLSTLEELSPKNIPTDADELLKLLKRVFVRRKDVLDLEELYSDCKKLCENRNTEIATRPYTHQA